MKDIKNIIFDLGGVFINIHYQKTSDAFKELGILEFDEYFKQDYSNSLFIELEEGKITDEEFYKKFRKLTNTNISNQKIQEAWNALLGNFWQDRLDWLQVIRKKYNCYLYSNTNSIHYNAFMKSYEIENPKRKPFNDYFIKAFYSQQIGFRKPNVAAFEFVLKQASLNANETLFIDDTAKNIVGAKQAGLQTLLLTEEMDLCALTL